MTVELDCKPFGLDDVRLKKVIPLFYQFDSSARSYSRHKD